MCRNWTAEPNARHPGEGAANARACRGGASDDPAGGYRYRLARLDATWTIALRQANAGHRAEFWTCTRLPITSRCGAVRYRTDAVLFNVGYRP